MQRLRVVHPSPWRQAHYATNARPPHPPPPRPYQKPDPSSRKALPSEPWESPQPKKRTLMQRILGIAKEPLPFKDEPKDIARGFEATQRAVQTGILDPRYRPAAWQVTKILCALPIVIVVGYHLIGRGFGWEEQKVRSFGVDGKREGAT
ncbi:hypothetical protein LTR62_006137 [Meristemomyces frigidus]|uniref:Uncharacterized protein n=1 Tax=Meristemomyces frigidus TaxID=1508187 RepID=A0AAN7TC56_9PEZI|nr:hypothetical protein LTR62_006137 [Meristemomyces frigidus]